MQESFKPPCLKKLEGNSGSYTLSGGGKLVAK
jgi:hypothetical protein